MLDRTLKQDFTEFIGGRLERREPVLVEAEKKLNNELNKYLPRRDQVYFGVEDAISIYTVSIRDHAYMKGFADALELLTYLKG